MSRIKKTHKAHRERSGGDWFADVITAGLTHILPNTGPIKSHSIKLKRDDGRELTVEGATRRQVEQKAHHAYNKLKHAK